MKVIQSSIVGLFSIILLSFITIYISTPAFAQSSTSSNTSITSQQDIHTISQHVMEGVLSATVCQLAGIDPGTSDHKCVSGNGLGFGTAHGGLVGVMTNMIGMTYNIPVHTSDYVAYVQHEFGPTKTFAATPLGIGFKSLSPLLDIWVAFRNVVYLLFVIVFLIIGICIMLRVQIDPRTVMTIENQIPGIVIALILATFSLAIAGGLIDLMWLFTFVIINILGGVDLNIATTAGTAALNNSATNNLTHIATISLFQNPIGYANEVLGNGVGGVLNLTGSSARGLQMILGNLFSPGVGGNGLSGSDYLGLKTIQTGTNCQGILDVGCWLGQAIGATIGNIISAVLGFLLSWILGILGFLIILIALLIALFRTWFMLLRAFAFIILDIILAPFHIVLGLIPGSQIGFGAWIRGLLSNLAVFPTVVFVFMLARVLIDEFSARTVNGQSVVGAAGGSLFVPPLIGNPNGTANDNPLVGFIALALILMLPEILKTLQKTLQVQENGLGAAAFAGFAAGGKAFSGGVRRGLGIHSAYSIDPLHASQFQRARQKITG